MEGFRSFLSILALICVFVSVRGQSARINYCSSNQHIPCDDGQCIRRHLWCNEGIDCADGSDEKYCGKRRWYGLTDHTCTEKHFTCKDGRCVPDVARCDTFKDCEDNSDEYQCEATTVSTPQTESGSDIFDHSTPYTTSTTPRTDFHTSRYPETKDEYSGRTVYDNNDNTNYDYGSRNRNKGSDTVPDSLYTPGPPDTVVYPQTMPTRRSHDSTPAHRTQYDSIRPSRNPYAERQPPLIIPPRSVVYSPRQRPSYTTHRSAQNPSLPPFFFSKNYTEDISYNYERKIRKGKEWILSQRDRSYAWGKNTPRALIALSLMTNSFSSMITDNDLMKKSFQTHLGIKILRNNTRVERMSTTRLAMYINALMATCQDPRDFWGLNLVDILDSRRNTLQAKQAFVNPLIYLSQCLTNKSVSGEDMRALARGLRSKFRTEVAKDIHILTSTALACFLQYDNRNRLFRDKLNDAFGNLLSQRLNDGSFGSIYTTALAAQALMSMDNEISWDPRRTLDYLATNQLEDGSFGDMQATYYTLLALSGRSLVHLRNTKCDPKIVDETLPPDDQEPTKNVLYSLRVGNPETFSMSLMLTVPLPANFFEIMQIAQRTDSRYKFSYKITNNELGVHTIGNAPSDAERGLFWNLYRLRPADRQVDLRQRFTGDIRDLVPDDGDELLYWYLPVA